MNNQALATFPSITIGQEHLAVILFVMAILGVAFGMLVALFLLFRNQHRDTSKGPKRFLLSNWK